MKQLLFLLLFPCLALAQYPGNAGQKITLGEQTTADGLVYRGNAAADTTLKPSVDTMAYILLDTNTNIIWQYKKAVNNAWTRVGGSVANGGTGQSTLTANKVMVGNGTSGVLTPTNLHWDNTNERLGVGTVSPDSKLHVVQSTSTANASGIRLTNTTTSPTGFNNFSYNITQNIEPSSSSSGDYGAMSLLTSFNNANVNTGRFNYAINSTSTNASTGTISNMYGSVSSAGSSNASGTVTNAESTRSSIYNNNGTITNAYGFRFGGRIFTGATQATIVNAYGLYINNVDFATTLNYSLYSVGGTNYFGGNVGIGTATPAVQFHTTGAVRFATFAGGGTTTLSVDNTGNLARTSSIELKKDVTPISYGLNEILQINPINFNWIDEDKFGNENENGFIAEDVMSVIPNVVAADTHGLFMDYTKLIPILTKAIQEQQALIKALEQRILTLENK